MNSPKTGPEQIERESSGSHSQKSKQPRGDVIVAAQISVLYNLLPVIIQNNIEC
jgi:hypothetical protein